MENLVRDADAAMYSAKSLGRNQTYIFAEPDEDARVPRAPDLGRRPRPRDGDRPAGARCGDGRADLVHRAAPPLPRPAVGADRLDRGRDGPAARAARGRDRPDPGRRAAPRRRQGRRPEEILDKPAALTSAEWRTVVQHPRIGQVILEQAAALRDAVPIILHHHERFAGHGYPYGLRANEIPLGARIVAIADAYDAMTHDRPYKRAMSHEAAIAELRRTPGRSSTRSSSRSSATCTPRTRRRPTRPSWPSRTRRTEPIVRRERRMRAVELRDDDGGEGHGLVDLGGADPGARRRRAGDGAAGDKHGSAAG